MVKKVLKTTILTLVFSCFIFGMNVAIAQVDTDVDNPNINNPNDNVPNNNIPNNNNINDNNNLKDNDNKLNDVADLDDDNNLGEILTYGVGGALLGSLITYFAVRERRTT